MLTLNLLTTTIVAPPSNASKWQMGFNSAFKGLMELDTDPRLNIYEERFLPRAISCHISEINCCFYLTV
jgi:hypothetical protein